MPRPELPNIEKPEMEKLADDLAKLLNNHQDTGLNYVQAIVLSLRRGNLDQARWYAFEAGDKMDSGIEDIQQFLSHELFFDTVDQRMIPLDDDS